MKIRPEEEIRKEYERYKKVMTKNNDYDQGYITALELYLSLEGSKEEEILREYKKYKGLSTWDEITVVGRGYIEGLEYILGMRN